jgi:hypothetical protein
MSSKMGAKLMKRFFLSLVAVVITGAVSTPMMAQSQPQTQPLGDYARAVKKTKPAGQSAAKTYDNDTLPGSSSLSVVGKPSQPAEADKDKEKDAASQAASGEKSDAQKKAEKSGETKPGQAAEDRKKALDAWKEKLSAQQAKIDLLSRELDVMQRESQIRAAAFYADAGNRLRNSADWDTQDRKYKQEIADKRKAIDEAKTQLSDLQEQARKSGVPNSAAQ